MNQVLRAFKPEGTLRVQPSKSVLHRALICSSLADGISVIRNFAESRDIQATMKALTALGMSRQTVHGDTCSVDGSIGAPARDVIECGESGTTLRMLFPFGLDGNRHEFRGEGRLMQRPFAPYEHLCAQQSILFERTKDAIVVQGTLETDTVAMPGDISSQFISGLMLAFSCIPGTGRIVLTSELQSAPYVALTREMMSSFGVVTEFEDNTFTIPGGQTYLPRAFTVESDYSHAAAFAAAAALRGNVTLRGLKRDSVQGDRAILDILDVAGAKVEWRGTNVSISEGALRPIDLDMSQIPDLVPVLAAFACGINGRSTLGNAGRLRFKESDRLHAMQKELSRLGAKIEETDDSLIVDGTGALRGGCARAHGDHRVVMALAVASVISRQPVVIEGSENVAKSAPGFFAQWGKIGGGTV